MKDRKIEFLDLIVILVKRKKLLLYQSIVILIMTYLLIYFFIPPQYDATAVIVPSNQNSMGGISSLLNSFSSLPISIPGVEGGTQNTDMFETIIFSRSTAIKMIKKFNLQEDYNLKSLEKTIKQFGKNVSTLEVNSSAYSIKIRASSPEKSAQMTNYLVSLLNETIINLDIKKAIDNKDFLEKRYKNIQSDLKSAEDSLTYFQKRTGVYIAEDQIKGTIETLTTFEAELAKKEMELSIFKQLFGVNDPKIKNKEIELKVYKNKLSQIKNGNLESSILLPIKDIPDESMNYLRLYRNVKIYNELLKFILPLYEQAKIDVQKKIPTLQIIDKAVPPEKKSYPLRVLTAVIITILIEILVFIWLLITEIMNDTKNPKLLFIKQEMFKLKSKKTSN